GPPWRARSQGGRRRPLAPRRRRLTIRRPASPRGFRRRSGQERRAPTTTSTIPRIGPPMRRSTSRLHQAPRARLDVFGPLPHDVGMRRAIKIYDTTLRDGTQGEGVSFSMEDKVRLSARFDAIGIHYIEGGWPGSNPKDLRFFRRMHDVSLKHAKLCAFSMTRRAGVSAAGDANMQALI